MPHVRSNVSPLGTGLIVALYHDLYQNPDDESRKSRVPPPRGKPSVNPCSGGVAPSAIRSPDPSQNGRGERDSSPWRGRLGGGETGLLNTYHLRCRALSQMFLGC